MTPWTVLPLVLYLSSNCVNTDGLYDNFGQTGGLRIPRSFLQQQSLANCFLHYYWPGCQFVPRDILLKMLTNTHSTGAHHYQREMFFRRLFGSGYNHRPAHPENVEIPVLVYPEPYKYDTPSNWPLHRRTFNKKTFRKPSYPTAAATPSALITNGASRRMLLNGEINSKMPQTGANILYGSTTLSPKTSTANFKSDEMISEPITMGPAYNIPSYESTVPILTTDTNVPIFLEEISNATSPVTTVFQSEQPTTITNTPALIHNVDISVITNPDDMSIKKYTIPKKITETIEILSTNHINGGPAENNDTFSTATQYRITSSKRRNHSITQINFDEIDAERKRFLLDSYSAALDKLERKFYAITFNKLTSISPLDRRENGISFVQSGLFLSLQLLAFSTETDEEITSEIDQCLGLPFTDMEKIYIIEEVVSKLPKSNFDLRWRWSSRLVLGAGQSVSDDFRYRVATALNITLGQFYGNETNEVLAKTLNQMIEKDSGGAIRNTFDPDELSEGVRAVALSTLYFRGRWRSAPTVLNNTRPFRDADGTPPRSVRMIRINDYVRYANLEDWSFQAIEIFYATRGLSLLMLVPYGRSLRALSTLMQTVSIAEISSRMIPMRVAVTMPLYTLRMTLLLPSKLQALGVDKLVSGVNDIESGQLKLSHAVQRLMFWAEAGRNAFKDDGIEWDADPEMEIVVDRPYLFFVRWHNITLMNGNFVL